MRAELIALMERFCRLGGMLPKDPDDLWVADDGEIADMRMILAEMDRTHDAMTALAGPTMADIDRVLGLPVKSKD